MDRTDVSGIDALPREVTDTLNARAPRRRFGIVSVAIRLAIAIAILAIAIFQAIAWISSRPAPPASMNFERTFTVEVIEPMIGTHRADIRAYGQVTSARAIDLRAQVQGQVVSISPNLVVGGAVEEGEILATVDSFAYDGAVVEARAVLADAELALAEAEHAHALEEHNITVAQAALTAAQTDLDRARTLLSSGSATQQTVDSRELAVSDRQQALNTARNTLFTLSARIQRQQAAIAQARYELQSAERDLANTAIRAPFDGVVTARNVTEGGHVNQNEAIASLYETAALEVSFTLADSQFGRLSADGLAGRPLEVVWTTGALRRVVPGTISRTAPQIDPATGGVTLYATLDPERAGQLRPGSFVSVTIEGLTHENSFSIPETAIYGGSHFYVMRDGRMAAVPVDILDRDGGNVIVSAPLSQGERVITTRLSQAGEGVAVEIAERNGAPPSAPGP